jgi:hypothetical protein
VSLDEARTFRFTKARPFTELTSLENLFDFRAPGDEVGDIVSDHPLMPGSSGIVLNKRDH